MQPVSPNRWRALPTALIVICAIALGAVTARADEAHRVPPPGGSAPGAAVDGGVLHYRAAASTSSAIR
jgi:hypothetical protein